MSKDRSRRVRGLPLTAIAVSSVALAFSTTAHAQEVRPIQVSLLTPVQIFPPEDTIVGLRLSVLYGRNAAVDGLDLGLVSHSEVSTGVQTSLVAISGSRLVGVQSAFVAIGQEIVGGQSGIVAVTDRIEGIQSGLVAVGQEVEGMQYGLVNYASSVRGFQLGLVNYAGTLRGLQIGLGNIIAEGGWLPFFPIFNFGL